MRQIFLAPHTRGTGSVVGSDAGWRLGIEPCSKATYCLAQLDDYAGKPRSEFPSGPPMAFSLRARVASPAPTGGTWGFGLWNDPFGLGCSPVGIGARLPVLPQAAWFFWASPRSYLSLSDDTPHNGFFAQAVCSERSGLWLAQAGLGLLLHTTGARRLMARRVAQHAARISGDPADWHHYEIRWHASAITFTVDNKITMVSPVVPRAPLGMVIWIDNQYAAYDPQGRIAWGTERVASEAWLEVQELACETTLDAG